MTKPLNRLAMAARIFCAVALLALGFGHRLPAAGFEVHAPLDAALHALPDGSLPVLCLNAGQDGGSGHDGFSGGCAFCRLSASFLLPAPGGEVEPAGRREIARLSPADFDGGRRPFLPNAAPRGPPLSRPA